MNDKIRYRLNLLINWCFILYFLILLIERTISVILTINKFGASYIYSTGYNGYIYTLVFISIVAFFVYFILKCRDVLPVLVGKRKDKCDQYFVPLSIASGIILLSGMVHTQETISGIQFASYGILIVGILLEVIIQAYSSKNLVSLWVSFAYLVSFSMAIPVVYEYVNMRAYVGLHAVEGIASIFLVGCLTYLLVKLFKGKGEKLFDLFPVLFMAGFDLVLIIWETLNGLNSNTAFFMIFMIVAVVLYIFGFFYNIVRDAKIEADNEKKHY